MIIRSICIWIAVFAVWGLLMNPVISREEAHEQKLTDLENSIVQVKKDYEREQNQKSELLKQREELSKKIENEIERGKSVKRLLE